MATNVKQTPIPVVPRTMRIVNADGTVTRSGQMMLEQLQAPIVTNGSHWTRPDPGSVQDGAVYIEDDRSVIYVNEGGEWHYLAGTMWGTLNPDERPTDLGPNDAGFDFRTTDTDPVYAPREFIWSGTQWVEATFILYGAHSARPPANSATPPRTIYVESDRSGVIYQQQANAWHYLAGTMYGTLSPDQRPADLGVNDSGFDFRTTDTNPLLGAREYIWSGTVWVEATPVLYGTHAGRPTGANAPPRCLYAETDRSEVLYQNQNAVWHFVAGTMWGTLSPDQRPTDLGVNDAGFTFRGTDQARSFVWSGTAWVETTSISGGASLTHTNVVTKVGSAGQIVEGSITDAGAANSDFLQITSTGNVGVNVAVPLSKFSVIPTTNPGDVPSANQITIGETSNNVGFRLSLGFGFIVDDWAGVIQTSNSGAGGRLLLNPSGGNVGIGLRPGFQLQLSADSAAKPATSSWTVSSDVRLKQNIEPVKDDSLAILGSLNWIRYEYNGQADTPRGLKAIGLEAHALRERLPEAVRSSKAKLNETDANETDLLAIDYHHILVHSARAIQQLDAEVKALRALIGKPQS